MKTTQRSLQYLTRRGILAGLVERHTPAFRPGGGAIPGGRRHDWLGFADILAIDEHPGILAVQACGGDVTAHQRKIEAIPEAVAFLRRGNRLVIHGWRKRKVKRGGVAVRWSPRIVHAELVGLCDAVTWREEPEETDR